MNLNERIAKIIEYSGYTPSEFADAVEVQRSSISHITSGRNKPSLDFLVKVKERFPELEWDWLIKGEGEMLKSEGLDGHTQAGQEKQKTTSLPDLFTLIEDDYLGQTESEDRVQKEVSVNSVSETPREFSEAPAGAAAAFLGDSQRSAPEENSTPTHGSLNQQIKLKRIVFFYENGKFESFEP